MADRLNSVTCCRATGVFLFFDAIDLIDTVAVSLCWLEMGSDAPADLTWNTGKRVSGLNVRLFIVAPDGFCLDVSTAHLVAASPNFPRPWKIRSLT